MRLKKTYKILIFLIILVARLYFVFQTPHFENEGYLVKRFVENILETGNPVIYDQLSYNGREVLYSPLYFYVLALFGLILGSTLALKLIPSIFISLLVFIVYGLSKKLVNNDNLAMFIALMSGFIPIVFTETLANASIYTLVIPVMFYLVYLFMEVDSERKVKKFIFFSFFLSLLHPTALLFSIGLIFYFILASTEGIKIGNLKEELIIFNVLSTFFIQFLIYKKAFLAYGLNVIWNNIPIGILGNYFDLDLLGLLYKVGTLVIIFGLIGIIWGIVKRKDKFFLIGGLILSILILLWLRLLSPRIGLMFLSIALVLAAVLALNLLLRYLEKTKIPMYRISFMVIVFGLFVLSLVVPTYYYASKQINEQVPNDYEVLVLNWIKDNALPDVTVLAPLEKGYLISEVARKRNVLDSNFLLAPDTSERYEDIKLLYSTKSEVTALELIRKYNIDYIFIPIETELKYGKVKWTDDTNCFKGIFFGTPKVYQVTC
jgi:4-amino-4-deoxy-L-arabinose transferase-like glycosyltransferase